MSRQVRFAKIPCDFVMQDSQSRLPGARSVMKKSFKYSFTAATSGGCHGLRCGCFRFLEAVVDKYHDEY